MDLTSTPRPPVSPLLPIAEHRSSKVCDSFFLDEVARGPTSGKASSRYGKKVMRPLAKLKKAFLEMLVSEEQGATSLAGRDWVGMGTVTHGPATAPAFSVGMGMVPVHFG